MIDQFIHLDGLVLEVLWGFDVLIGHSFVFGLW